MTLQFHSWAYIQRQPESKIYKHPNVHTSAIHNGQGSNLNARWRWMALENFPMIHSFSFLLCQLESHKLATPNTPRHLEVCLYYPCLMAPHSSTLAWQIPWMEEPGRLQSMGSLGVRHDWSNLADSLSPSVTLTLSFKCVSHFAVSDATHPCCCCLFSRYPCQTLRPHGLQHTRFLCPSLSPWVCVDSHPLSWWYYLAISSSAAHFFCLQSFPVSGSFPVNQLFTLGGQSIPLQHQSFQWIFRVDFP